MSVLTEQLVAIAQQARSLPHGTRTLFYDQWSRQLNMSRQTLLRKLKGVSMSKTRKRRDDAGVVSLELGEAQHISTFLMECIRKNDKRNATIKHTVELLRANGVIKAVRIDKETGEEIPLSDDAIARALRNYGLHLDQLLQPTPAIALRSAHPNHVWEVDASISAQFYMATSGSKAIDPTQVYAGKPENVKKIEKQRLWRYVITDHTSGTLYVEYVLGAETSENLTNVFINAMQKRHEHDPFHGVPLVMMTDPGAAMTSAMFRNLCKGLGVDLIINKVGNARAKGQVEQAHNIVERLFESRLAIQKANSLEEVNELAWRWMRYYNATAIHTRHGLTRFGNWLKILPEQLRFAPTVEVCRDLAISNPETRVVNNYLHVSFRGSQFDVADIPDIGVGQELLVVRNPWRDEDGAQIVLRDENGREVFYPVEKVVKDVNGFNETGAMIGKEFKAIKQTTGEKNSQTLEQIATGTSSVGESESARKAKQRVMAHVNPHADVEQFKSAEYMPKRGTDLDFDAPQVVTKALTHVDAAVLLRQRMGNLWQGAKHFKYLQDEYAEGVPSEALDTVEEALRNPPKAAAGLKVVGGF